MVWIILPGLALAPQDFFPLARRFGPDTRILDEWKAPATGDLGDMRAELDAENCAQVGLIGHSVGGLAALEWAIRYPDQVRRLILLDSTVPPKRLASQASVRDGTPRIHPKAVQTISAMMAPVSQLRRRTVMRIVTGEPDSLPAEESKRRFGSAPGVQTLAKQWFQSIEQEHRLGRLLASGARSAPDLLVEQIAGCGPWNEPRFFESQQRLARMINSQLTILPGRLGHLFPVTHPDVVVEYARPL